LRQITAKLWKFFIPNSIVTRQTYSVPTKSTRGAVCGRLQGNSGSFFYPIQIPLSPDKHTVCPQSPLGVLKNCGAETNWASHMRFAADYSETLEVFLIPFKFHYHQTNIQYVHKVHSGFWKIVARKPIELAACGLRQITAKLWKFFIPNSIVTRQTYSVPTKSTRGFEKLWRGNRMRFAADYSETLEVFLSHSNSIIIRQTYSVSTKSTRGFEKLWLGNELS
jgi:hypothetical protein